MGLFWSRPRHRHDSYPQNPPPIPSPTAAGAGAGATISSSSSSYVSPTPPPPPPQRQSPSPNQYPLPIPPSQLQAPPPPPPPQPSYSSPPRPNYSQPYPMPSPSYAAPSSYYQQPPNPSWVRHPYPLQYYPPNRPAGWWYPPPAGAAPYAPAYGQQQLLQPAPPPYVEHQKAKTIKNDVNVHKDTIRLVADEQNPDLLLISFTFDATVNGSVTIYYFAKEKANGEISVLDEDIYEPKTVAFQKGPGQKFIQQSGSGIDLGFFELDELSKTRQDDTYPLVIYAKAAEPSPPKAEPDSSSSISSHAQITLAIIEKNNENFQVRVMKQVLWIDGERYELQEIFGLVNSVEKEVVDGENDDQGKDCVICLSEPRDTAVLPCRHMCMCSECAKALRLQSNKCPICRQPVEQLLEIKVNSDE